MSEKKADFFDAQVSPNYEIRVGACLDSSMVDWLGNFTVCHPLDAETVLIGFLPDQSALFGILLRLHNLGIPLISVNLLPAHGENIRAAEGKPEVPENPKEPGTDGRS
jgi:hypothetical protein